MGGNHNQFLEQDMSHCPTQGKYSLSLEPFCGSCELFSFIFPWWVPPLYQTHYFTIFSYKIKRMFATLGRIPNIIKGPFWLNATKCHVPKYLRFLKFISIIHRHCPVKFFLVYSLLKAILF